MRSLVDHISAALRGAARPGRAGAFVAACLAAAAPATADTPPVKKKRPDPPPPPSPPDPIVEDAANANLESASRHQGMNVTLALGGGFTLGIDIDNSVGRGGSGSLRLAQVAGEKFAFTLELATVVLLHQVKGTMTSSEIKRDQDTNFLLGLQYYVNRSLWLRMAGGIGVFDRADVEANLAGPAGLLGGGIDLVRSRRFAFGIEVMTIGMINRDGFLAANAFMIDLSIE